MTEQPPSAEALKIAQRWGYPGMKLGSEIDALIAQHVSAETERCADLCGPQAGEAWWSPDAMIVAGAIRNAIRAPAERPASEGPQRLMEGMRREGLPDDHPLQSGPSALASTGEQPSPEITASRERLHAHTSRIPSLTPEQKAALFSGDDPEVSGDIAKSPAAVVDYTEQARVAISELVLCYGFGFHANCLEEAQKALAKRFSAVASEHQAALQLAEAKVAQLSETAGEDYSIGYESGTKALLARLREPDVQDAIATLLAQEDTNAYEPEYKKRAASIIARIVEMLTP